MKILIILIILGIGIALGGIVFYPSESENVKVVNTIDIEYDETITIGIVHRDAEKMFKRYQPLAEHIAKKLVMKVKTIKDL